jgi:hypothetical protein
MEQKILFNKNECELLKSFLERKDIVKTTKDARGSFNTTIGVIPPNEIPIWFFEKIKSFGIKEFIFENKLAVSRSAIVNLYGTGGYFDRHRDDYPSENHWIQRYKTLVIQLSDATSYDGGDLLVNEIPIDRQIGNVVYFNSSTYHELTKITRGVRYSLIMWFDRDDILESKSIL